MIHRSLIFIILITLCSLVLFFYKPYLSSSEPRIVIPSSSSFSLHHHHHHPQSNHKMSSTSTKKTAVVIFSHGLGDTSRGWTFLVEQFHSRMPWIKWILPDAPVQPVTLNGGLQMPSWFDIAALDPGAPEDEKGLLESVGLINQYVQREIDNGIPAERIIVGGFSQGATIGILTGLTNPHKLAGAVSLSGFLQLTDNLKELRKPHSVSLPVFWGHGTDDDLVRYSWGQESVEFLVKTLGMKRVDFKTYQGLGHSASQKEIEEMMTWIAAKLPA